jgi:peptidoglycan/xylan/chitin deacetylase (PgdA/CDA1 family)
MYVCQNHVGVPPYNGTVAQMLEQDAAGWDMANHTVTHTDFNTLNQAQEEAELSGCKAYLDGLGLTRASMHAAWVYSHYDADTPPAMLNTGILTGRAGTSGTPGIALPMSDLPYHICHDSFEGSPWATIQGWIDAAKARQNATVTLVHNTIGVDLANLLAALDYAIQQHVVPLTISQFYALQSGSLTIPRPAGW